MNTKIALFLSTTLTAFVVATLSGVVNKVTSTSPAIATAPVQAVVQQDATATLEQPTDLPTATVQTPLGPEQAAKLAAMVPNPRYYDAHRNARGLLRKPGIILARMNAAEVP